MGKPQTAQLVVRNLEQEVKTRLQKRAKRHGRSMEEEVRDILRDAVKKENQQEEGFGTRFASHFKGIGLKKGEEIQELRGEVWARPVDFSGKEFDPKKK
jgi:plasmid stability protein